MLHNGFSCFLQVSISIFWGPKNFHPSWGFIFLSTSPRNTNVSTKLVISSYTAIKSRQAMRAALFSCFATFRFSVGSHCPYLVDHYRRNSMSKFQAVPPSNKKWKVERGTNWQRNYKQKQNINCVDVEIWMQVQPWREHYIISNL